jgi:hypothetical protein
MNDIQDTAAMALRLRRLEQIALASNASPPPLRTSAPPRSANRDDAQRGNGQRDGAHREDALREDLHRQDLHRDDARLQPEIYPGAAVMRARGNQPGISPWLFVMATALNTMVAAVLAVIITLGVVRQDRTDNPPRESAPMAAAYAKTVGSGGVPIQLVAMGYTVDLRPIGSPDQPLRLAPRKPARLPLQIQPDDAAREPFILVLAGAPPGTTLSGATRIGSDTWFLPPGAASMLEITVPEWSTAPFEVVMELRRMNGAPAAQAKAWIAVPPPATPEAAWAKADDGAAKELMTRADLLLEQGNVIAARTV